MLGRRVAALAVLATALVTLIGAGLADAGDGAPAPLPDPSVSPEDVRQQADDILNQRQFQRPEPSMLEKAQDWVSERIGRLLTDLVSGGAGSVIGWVVLILAVGLLVYFLVRIGRNVQADPRGSSSVTVERARSAADWRDDAEAHERSGRWKAALRSRFRALLADLVTLGRVDDVPGRTAGEYRDEVAESVPEGASAFAEATDLFEVAWYGNRPTGPDENARFRSLADEVVAEAERTDVRAQEPVGVSG